jgi:tRNA(adenine34) deaminase
MGRALDLARIARAADEVPVGALLVRDGEVIGEGYNQPRRSNDPTAHAEVVALRDAGSRQANYRLPGSTLYVTVEPCSMCVGAIVHARVQTLVFGTTEPKTGAVVSQIRLFETAAHNHAVSIVQGVCEEECRDLMVSFFEAKRQA